MKVAITRETFPGERRVALVPADLPKLAKAGYEILVESGAGEAAGFPDALYAQAGAAVLASREAAFAADVVVQVRALGANPDAGRADLPWMRAGQILIGLCDPLGSAVVVKELAEAGVTLFALELIPRTTRAQSMDVLSSMATVSGYRAVLTAAYEFPRMLSMVTYAAGILRPAHVFVIGAGVAGLRAIATARQLGAMVQAHDIRPGSRDEVQSVGARFVELELEGSTQDEGGYARQLTEADYSRQRDLIARVSAESDIVITTAAIPGRKSPLLVTAAAVRGMRPGSVIVDLAAERGGNCELSRPDETVIENGVKILGPTNTPSEVPTHASQMFSANVTRFMQNLRKAGAEEPDLTDEINQGTLAARAGTVTNARIRSLLGMEPLAPAVTESQKEGQP